MVKESIFTRIFQLILLSPLAHASASFLCFFVQVFPAFCSNFILNSIAQAMTTLGCRHVRSHRQASAASTHVELPHLLHSFISRFISNFNFKTCNFLLTSFQTYEVTWANYLDYALHRKNPNQILVVVFLFQPLCQAFH